MEARNMAKVLNFPHTAVPTENPFKKAMAAIEKRSGVSFQDYLGHNGKRSADAQATINKSLRKETFLIGNKS
jgi:hypothetical protein